MNTPTRDPLDSYPDGPDYDVIRMNQREVMLVTWPSTEACALFRDQHALRVRLFRDHPEHHARMLDAYGAIPLRRMYAPVRPQRLPHQSTRECQRRLRRAQLHTIAPLAA